MARPRKRLETELSRFLDAALKQSGLTHNEFARLIEMKPSSLSDLKLRDEDTAPDRKTVHLWAEILDLSEAQEDVLFDLIQLSHAPKYVQELLTRLRPLKYTRRVAESPLDYRLPE